MRTFAIVLAVSMGTAAHAIEEKTNPVTSHRITIMPGMPDGGFFGWIELRHAGKATGYIYLYDTPATSPGSLNSSKQYIVTQVPTPKP